MGRQSSDSLRSSCNRCPVRLIDNRIPPPGIASYATSSGRFRPIVLGLQRVMSETQALHVIGQHPTNSRCSVMR